MDALIVDIDGTLAHHMDPQTRGHHEYAKVGEDRPDYHIIHLVRLYSQAGYKIVITSGRPDSCNACVILDGFSSEGSCTLILLGFKMSGTLPNLIKAS